MIPTIGKMLHYILDYGDAQAIKNNRSTNPGFYGIVAKARETVPLIVTRVIYVADKPHVNGHILLDGNDTHWVDFVEQGTKIGTWHFTEKPDEDDKN